MNPTITNLLSRCRELIADPQVSVTTKARLSLASMHLRDASIVATSTLEKLTLAARDMESALSDPFRGTMYTAAHRFNDAHYSKVSTAVAIGNLKTFATEVAGAITEAESDKREFRAMLARH